VEAAWQQYRIIIVAALRQQNRGSSTAVAERCTPEKELGCVGLLWSMRGMSPREATAHVCVSFFL
jgi:hypothetical protein